jgi:hypothetical protein
VLSDRYQTPIGLSSPPQTPTNELKDSGTEVNNPGTADNLQSNKASGSAPLANDAQEAIRRSERLQNQQNKPDGDAPKLPAAPRKQPPKPPKNLGTGASRRPAPEKNLFNVKINYGAL